MKRDMCAMFDVGARVDVQFKRNISDSCSHNSRSSIRNEKKMLARTQKAKIIVLKAKNFSVRRGNAKAEDREKKIESFSILCWCTEWETVESPIPFCSLSFASDSAYESDKERNEWQRNRAERICAEQRSTSNSEYTFGRRPHSAPRRH